MNWQYERSMTPDQFKWAIKKLGMSQAAAARFLGLSQRQIYRMVHGHGPVPVVYVLLLWSMIHHGDEPVVPIRIKGAY